MKTFRYKCSCGNTWFGNHWKKEECEQCRIFMYPDRDAMKREEILKKAESLINGPRAKQYGHAQENFERIMNGWNPIVASAIKLHGRLTPKHIALMMDWLKTSRLLEDIEHEDSWVDKIGYTALGAELDK